MSVAKGLSRHSCDVLAMEVPRVPRKGDSKALGWPGRVPAGSRRPRFPGRRCGRAAERASAAPLRREAASSRKDGLSLSLFHSLTLHTCIYISQRRGNVAQTPT